MQQRADNSRTSLSSNVVSRIRHLVIGAAGVAGLVGLPQWAAAAAWTPGRPAEGSSQAAAKFLTQPIVNDIYTADPSAHVFNGKIFIYPSHDIDAGVKPDDLGSHFAMRDYHVFSMDSIDGNT